MAKRHAATHSGRRPAEDRTFEQAQPWQTVPVRPMSVISMARVRKMTQIGRLADRQTRGAPSASSVSATESDRRGGRDDAWQHAGEAVHRLPLLQCAHPKALARYSATESGRTRDMPVRITFGRVWRKRGVAGAHADLLVVSWR